jgi:hypothetical protein
MMSEFYKTWQQRKKQLKKEKRRGKISLMNLILPLIQPLKRFNSSDPFL